MQRAIRTALLTAIRNLALYYYTLRNIRFPANIRKERVFFKAKAENKKMEQSHAVSEHRALATQILYLYKDDTTVNLKVQSQQPEQKRFKKTAQQQLLIEQHHQQQ
jgi:hypothetical protein